MEMTLGSFGDSQGIVCHRSLATVPVFHGGPVEPERGWILHTDHSIVEKRDLLPGFFVSGSNETLRKLLSHGEGSVRLLLGYAGWGPGQLEKEMIDGVWITAEANAKYVFEIEPRLTWNSVLGDLGVDPNRLMVGTGLH